MDKKRRRLERKQRKRFKRIQQQKRDGYYVLGFDEGNNGFHIMPTNPYFGSSTVIVGYLSDDLGRANYGSRPYERKGGNNNKGGLERALVRAREYINSNPNFLYTPVPKELIEITPLSMVKGNAIANLTFKFLKRYKIDPQKTSIIIDSIDRKIHSEEVLSVLNMWFKKIKLNIEYRIKKNSDENTIAVRTADRIAYYISLIHHYGKSHKWPFRSRKVSYQDMDKNVIEILEDRDKSY